MRRGASAWLTGAVHNAKGVGPLLDAVRHPVGHDLDALVARAIRVVAEQRIDTVDGGSIPVVAHSILLHGDSAGAVQTARSIREGLLAAGVRLAPLADVLDAVA